LTAETQGVLDLVVSMGLQGFETMLEHDRETLCGLKWKRLLDRTATRARRTRGDGPFGCTGSLGGSVQLPPRGYR
jgi:hypothetical protein